MLCVIYYCQFLTDESVQGNRPLEEKQDIDEEADDLLAMMD
jgi:hypothetical protein